jgi:hypothetical protein
MGEQPPNNPDQGREPEDLSEKGVEVWADGADICVRDGKDPGGTVLRFTHREFLAFLQGAKAGEFDDMADDPPTPD